MHVLHVDVGNGGRDFAEDRDATRQTIDVRHGEVDFALVRGGEEVQHRVGRAAHGDIERHRILECREIRDGAGETRSSSCS